MKVAAILIAAGLSSRMGGPNKLLQPIGTATLIEHTFAQLIQAKVDEVVVVTGRDHEEVTELIKRSHTTKTRLVHNADFEKGMTGSIQKGLGALANADALMVCLSDMPELRAQNYNELIHLFKKEGSSEKILAPYKKDIKGNPVIFGSDYFGQIKEHKEANGCSAIIKSHKNHILRLDTSSEAYFFDIDTPEALKNYQARAK
jgi:molybdenum cofactor cytidylyltransferase